MPTEHIYASALYYYDSSNVTDSHPAFRGTVNHQYLDASWMPGPQYERYCCKILWEIFGPYCEDDMGVSPASHRS